MTTAPIVRDLGPDFEIGRTCPECGRTIHPKDLFLSGFDPIVSADGEEHPGIKEWYGSIDDSVSGFTSRHGSGLLYVMTGDLSALAPLGWEEGDVLHRSPEFAGTHGAGVGFCPGKIGRVRL